MSELELKLEPTSTKDYCQANYVEFFDEIADKVVDKLRNASAKGITFIPYIASSVEEGEMVAACLRSSRHYLYVRKVELRGEMVSTWETFFGMSVVNQAKMDGRYFNVSFRSLS